LQKITKPSIYFKEEKIKKIKKPLKAPSRHNLKIN